MILGEQVYKLITKEMLTIGIPFYTDYVPAKTEYPFILARIMNINDIDLSFEHDYETIKVRFEIFSDDIDCNHHELFELGKLIQEKFDRSALEFVDTTNGKSLLCSVLINNSMANLDNETDFKAIMDFDFVCTRNIT